MTWRHALLEIYVGVSDVAEDWPTEGTSSYWIGEHKVAYCNGEWADAVAFLPLYKLLWWKARFWAGQFADLVRRCYYALPWVRDRVDREWEDWLAIMSTGDVP